MLLEGSGQELGGARRRGAWSYLEEGEGGETQELGTRVGAGFCKMSGCWLGPRRQGQMVRAFHMTPRNRQSPGKPSAGCDGCEHDIRGYRGVVSRVQDPAMAGIKPGCAPCQVGAHPAVLSADPLEEEPCWGCPVIQNQTPWVEPQLCFSTKPGLAPPRPFLHGKDQHGARVPMKCKAACPGHTGSV